MKKNTPYIFIVILALSTLSIYAQAPKFFKYQAVARDATGQVIANQPIGFRINLLKGSQDGTVIFSETHAVTSNSFGLVNIAIGSGKVETGHFSTISWGADKYFIMIEMDETGGTNYQRIGTSQLLSVPYALYAETSGNDLGKRAADSWTTSGDSTWLTNLNGRVGIGFSNPSALLHVAKSMTEPMITIQNLGANGGATYRMTDNASGGDWKFKSTGSGGFKIRDHANSLNVIFIEANSAPNAIYIANGGNIGMGTLNPEQKLDVNGNFKADTLFGDGSQLSGINSGLWTNIGDTIAWCNHKVGIGVSNPESKLVVDGLITAKAVKVTYDGWADFVFADNYKLRKLEEVENFIKIHKHLPGVPSEKEITENGATLGEIDAILLQKIEEMILYIIELKKENNQQQQQINALNSKLTYKIYSDEN